MQSNSRLAINKPSKSIEMNKSYMQKSRNDKDMRQTQAIKPTNNDLLNVSNLSVGHMSREGI